MSTNEAGTSSSSTNSRLASQQISSSKSATSGATQSTTRQFSSSDSTTTRSIGTSASSSTAGQLSTSLGASMSKSATSTTLPPVKPTTTSNLSGSTTVMTQFSAKPTTIVSAASSSKSTTPVTPVDQFPTTSTPQKSSLATSAPAKTTSTLISTPSSTIAAQGSCASIAPQGSNSDYVTSGARWSVTCSTTLTGLKYAAFTSESFNACLFTCELSPICRGVNYQANLCTLYSIVSGSTPKAGHDCASKKTGQQTTASAVTTGGEKSTSQPKPSSSAPGSTEKTQSQFTTVARTSAEPGTTTARTLQSTPSSSSAKTSASATASVSSASRACTSMSTKAGVFRQDKGDDYAVFCEQGLTGTPVEQTYQRSYEDCLRQCDIVSSCAAFVYKRSDLMCSLLRDISGRKVQPGYDCGVSLTPESSTFSAKTTSKTASTTPVSPGQNFPSTTSESRSQKSTATTTLSTTVTSSRSTGDKEGPTSTKSSAQISQSGTFKTSSTQKITSAVASSTTSRAQTTSPAASATQGATTGTPRTITATGSSSPTSGSCTSVPVSNGVYRPASSRDYAIYCDSGIVGIPLQTVQRDTYSACLAECNTRILCRAFTFQTTKKTCTLLSVVGSKISNTGDFDSGVVVASLGTSKTVTSTQPSPTKSGNAAVSSNTSQTCCRARDTFQKLNGQRGYWLNCKKTTEVTYKDGSKGSSSAASSVHYEGIQNSAYGLCGTEECGQGQQPFDDADVKEHGKEKRSMRIEEGKRAKRGAAAGIRA
ncbi:hypothetical protein CAC42_793 [Sphaceloma murrayae]|uniref:Apple domain-containing protein n=1 Tax=Sphaceloma murrayae TaxID=2082308 RepID=A0A2K1QK44_9PEZI|nr:hypothetical protein CAC42_793 [Sphaceloma murrayae]